MHATCFRVGPSAPAGDASSRAAAVIGKRHDIETPRTSPTTAYQIGHNHST